MKAAVFQIKRVFEKNDGGMGWQEFLMKNVL